MQHRHALVSFVILLIVGRLAAAAGGPVGTVVAYQGDAFAIGTPGARRLHKGRSIHAGDILVTGESGRLQVRLIDGSAILLGQSTRLFLAGVLQPQPDQGRRTVLVLRKGLARLATGTQAARDRIEIRTGLADIVPDNAEIQVEFRPGRQGLDLLLVQGDGVTVSNPAGRVSMQSAGAATFVGDSQTAPRAPAPWPPARRAAALARTGLAR